jgi:MoxR-like ATPase
MLQVAQAVPVDVQWLTRAVEAFEKQLEIEWSAPASAGDDSAGKLALARAIAGPGAQDSEQGLVRMVSDRALKRYSALHVATRVAQVDEARERAVAALRTVQSTGQVVMEQARGHPWLPPSWRGAIEAAHKDNAQRLGALVARLDDAHEGFATLPVDAALAGDAPKPVPLAA